MTTTTEPTHLSPQTQQALGLPAEQRIERIRAPRWIGYPRAQTVLAKLEDLLTYPRSHRMPNLLLVGETNNGKSMLVERFRSRHPARDNPRGEGVVVPVLVIQAPPTPDEGRFYNAILERLFAPYRPHDRVDRKQTQVLKLLGLVHLQMLIVDEVHHILAGNLNKQRGFLNVLKYLGNELQVPIVGVGTKDAFRAIQTDPQLANRFEPTALPRWNFDNDFLRLLVSFERMLPLHLASNLHETTLATKLLAMSEGYLGELSKLLTHASVMAVTSGAERIDAKLLDGVDWTPPSERRRQAERLL